MHFDQLRMKCLLTQAELRVLKRILVIVPYNKNLKGGKISKKLNPQLWCAGQIVEQAGKLCKLVIAKKSEKVKICRGSEVYSDSCNGD